MCESLNLRIQTSSLLSSCTMLSPSTPSKDELDFILDRVVEKLLLSRSEVEERKESEDSLSHVSIHLTSRIPSILAQVLVEQGYADLAQLFPNPK